MTDQRRRQNLVGQAGEHYVLSRLLLFGVPAALAPAGMRDIDLLVFDADRDQVSAGLQVKTTSLRAAAWSFHEKHERWSPPNCFYALVNLHDPLLPATWIVPANKIAGYVIASHQAWLATPNRQGGEHRDTPIRRVQDRNTTIVPGYPDGWLAPYREAWDPIVY